MRPTEARNIEASTLSSKQNNFDALRLIAALLVLWSHSYPITGTGPEIFSLILGDYDTGGGLGVTIFFTISGFLVTRSVLERSPGDYLISRALRVLPGLALVTVATVIIIGPAMTRMSLTSYFCEPSTVSYLKNVFVFPIQYNLADTVSDLPFYKKLGIQSINTSLWTLPLECGFYIALLLFSSLKLVNRKFSLVILAAVGASYVYCTEGLGLSWAKQGNVIWAGVPAYPIVRYGFIFALASAMYLYRRDIRIDAGLAGGCVLALFAARGSIAGSVLYLVCIPYLVMYIALGVRALDVSKLIGDLSYGVYLFAFPVQQAIVYAFHSDISATKLSLIATPLVLVLAYFSWWWIEAKALGFKKTATRASQNE